MRMLAAIAMASVMMVSNAFAAAGNSGLLAPGKPAGLHDAQIETGGVLLVLGIVAAAADIASTTQGHNSSAAATTTTH